ncbi:MAG: RDD family protein [Pseudodonghicola sp.]|nr:RDD family protein [Pseudodonghicola sp.]
MSALPDPYNQPQFYDGVPTKRLIAWLFDSAVTFVLCLGVVLATAFVGLLIWPFLFLVLGFAYRVVTLANGSATWGMRFAGIELRDAAGARLDLGGAVAHTAGYTISIAFPILQVISVVMMLTGARGQGLTDTFLGTVALNRRALF